MKNRPSVTVYLALSDGRKEVVEVTYSFFSDEVGVTENGGFYRIMVGGAEIEVSKDMWGELSRDIMGLEGR